MTYRFELLPNSLTDIEEIFLWYQVVSPRLRDKFQIQIDISLKEIQSNPMVFHSLGRKVRCKKLRRFPYLIIYFVEKDLISVIAVIHEKRNPKAWKRRVRRK